MRQVDAQGKAQGHISVEGWKLKRKRRSVARSSEFPSFEEMSRMRVLFVLGRQRRSMFAHVLPLL